MESELFQPIITTSPEPGHDLKNVITIQQMIDLLKEEEDYWTGEQQNTKLMISRLRKIFYDQWGWNDELIRGAKDIETRYIVEIVDDPTEHTKALKRYVANEEQPKHRLVTYTATDRIYGNSRVGQVPFIYQTDHQEVVLPDGTYCDSAHILAGLDAYNYLEPVSPLPNWLFFLNFLVPHVDSNVDIVTWLGDIASSSGDFMFAYLKNNKKPISTEQEQNFINSDAPGSDMLGDIDPYVIAKHYDVGSTNGMRYTDILQDYYFNPKSARNRRFSIYAEFVGLKGWDGTNFKNEKQWLRYYKGQLRDNICFQVESLAKMSLNTIILLIRIWFGGYEKVLKKELLLKIYLKTLKEELKKETII
ncbi:MAG: hypothetical protein ACKVQB_10815 [Bacteroidia bacterium]